MSTHMIRPSQPQPREIRCDVGDAIVANLAIHVVFFFRRQLDPVALVTGFTRALDSFPIYAGRMTVSRRGMGIRCAGRGVPLTLASSDRTLEDAIRSTVEGTGFWLIDPVDGPTARLGLGPVCRVRITQLASDATAIGFSFHHAIGDMHTCMLFMNAWAAASAGRPIAEPVIADDRAAYLDEHLPADSARQPSVRCLGPAETLRAAWYLATGARRQRTFSAYFGDDEICRMRDAYAGQSRLSANDVVCAHVCEAVMAADPAVDRRSLAIVVNMRNRCGLDPMLVGNVLSTVQVDLRRGDSAGTIAERIRLSVDRFADGHFDMRMNQRLLDDAGPWRGARCVSTTFNPDRWNPLVSNLSGFGVYRLEFEGAPTHYCTLLVKLPVAGLGALMEGADGRGLVFQMALPPKELEAMSKPGARPQLQRFRAAGDDIPPLHRSVHP